MTVEERLDKITNSAVSMMILISANPNLPHREVMAMLQSLYFLASKSDAFIEANKEQIERDLRISLKGIKRKEK